MGTGFSTQLMFVFIDTDGRGGTASVQSRPMDVRDSYDSAADAYAEHLATELVHKPLDRHLDDG